MYVSSVVCIVTSVWCNYYTFNVTVAIHGAHVWFPAATIFLMFFEICRIADYSFVVAGYNCFDVIYAAVA